MSEVGSITRMAQQLGAEESQVRKDAAEYIWKRYAERLRKAASKWLAPYIRVREDEEDLLQELFLQLWRAKTKNYKPARDRDELWKHLLLLTRNECRDTARYHMRDKRNVHSQQPLQSGDNSSAVLPVEAPVAASEEATLEEREAALDFLLKLQDALPSPELQNILLFKLGGRTNKEIADKMDCSKRTIERGLVLIRIATLDLRGQTIDQMAAFLGITVRAVENKLRQLRRQGWQPRISDCH